jgi:hypothetical protein
MYDEDQAINSWYGFNRKNIWSKFTTAPTEATEEEKEFLSLINARLTQIRKELPFNKLGRKNIPDAPKNLAENNLYALTRAYQKGQNQLKENETLQAQKKNSILKVTKQHKAVLKELEERKSEQEQALLHNQFEVLLTSHEKGLEKLVVDCNAFQIQLTTVGQISEAVEKMLVDLKSKKIDEILPLISANQGLFSAINELLNRESYPEESIHHLNQNIHNLLMAIKEELAGLQKVAEGIDPMPKELAERQEQLMSQLKELDNKYSHLNTTLKSSLESLSNAKNLLAPFIKLAQIKNQYAEYIKQMSSGSKDVKSQELVKAIEITLKEKEELLKLISSEDYTGLLSLEQIEVSLNEQEKLLNNFLVGEKLQQIKDNYLRLIEKSRLIASKELKEPKEVIELVHGIEELDKQSSFVERVSLSPNPAIQIIITTINDLKKELNASLHGLYENTTRATIESYDAQLVEEQKKQTKTKEERASAQNTLDTLVLNANTRRDFLGKAQIALGQLKTNLTDNKEDEILKTSQKDMLAYFEDTPTGRASILVNTLYGMEQAKSSWYGINRANIWNRITSAYTSEETIAAKNELVKLIEARLLQITEELTINDITAVAERPSIPANLAENNLYALSIFYHNTNNSLVDKHLTLEQQIEDSRKITEQKERTLSLLESMKTSHEAQMLLNKLATGQEKIEQQAVLFGQDIALLQQMYQELDDVVDTIAPSLKEKIALQEKSLIELSKKMNESLQAHSQLFSEFETLFSKLTSQPLSMIEQKEVLSKKLDESKTNKVKLDELIRPEMLKAKKLMGCLENIASRARLAEQGLEEPKDASHDSSLPSLSNVYFGTETERADAEFGMGGLFGDYLKERAQTFWLNDLLSSIAAFALGCLGYKTGAQLRQEYLTNELQPALTSYQNGPNAESYEELMNIIKDGKIQFPARTARNAADQNKSLRFKLTQLETDVERIHLNELTVTDEQRNNQSFMDV